MQAAERQRISDSVYVGIPRPKSMGRGKQWKGTKRLLRQLELGLIVVSFERKRPQVEVVFHPGPYARRKLKSRKRAVIEEIEGRSGDYNQGGSSQQKLMTAYRENAVKIACFLEILGPQSPKALRALGSGHKTTSILYDNHYGWFERISRGVYGVTRKGRKEIDHYPGLAQQFASELSERNEAD